MINQKQYILGFKVNKTFWITFHKSIIFQQYYQSYCDYLLKTGRMDEEQAVSDFKKSSSTALKLPSKIWENFWELKAL